jgi:hypothetical protein
MKMNFLAILAAVAVIATGCVHTVSDTTAFRSNWSKDTIVGRYNRSVDQVYQASVNVIQQNGVMIREFIPHNSTNVIRSLQGKVNQRDVYISVESVDPKITQVSVQALGSWGNADIDVSNELEKEIALQLAR